MIDLEEMNPMVSTILLDGEGIEGYKIKKLYRGLMM